MDLVKKLIEPSKLFRQFQFPRFVKLGRRKHILRVYRRLIRESNRFIDPFCRAYLRYDIHDAFASNRYITKGNVIDSLVSEAKDALIRLEKANKGNVKSINIILKRCFSSYLTKKPRCYSFFNLKLEPSAAYRVYNMGIPDSCSPEQYAAGLEKNEHVFFQYLNASKAAKVIKGTNGRKLFFDPPLDASVLGKPLPQSRIENILKKHMNDLRGTWLLPYHYDVIEYLKQQYFNPVGYKGPKRFYVRRIGFLLDDAFCVVEKDGKLKLEFVYRHQLTPPQDID
ncbi:hypothetical protein TRVA0_001S03620 [Trichomonascus vanleenenianus]|uniref:uncharacterized protein n=1 Tax=Trichomonascus vanleenenianus TaxID=2268995 RepID=UPI003EC96256